MNSPSFVMIALLLVGFRRLTACSIKQIIAWLVANPERSSGDIFRELQRLSPGRYHPLQIRTLQRGMRKIRAHLLETFEEQWQEEVIHGRSPTPVFLAESAGGIS